MAKPSAATVVKIGSFDIGVNQTMFTANKATRARHIAKIEDIIATCVQEGSLDIFSLSELGDHGHGLHAASIWPSDLTIFKPTGIDFLVEGAYMTVWGFKPDATHLGAMNSVTCILKSFFFPSQLVIQVFTVPTCTAGNLHRGDLSKFLIHGNLHIRIPNRGPMVTTMSKKRVLQEAMWQLERRAELKGSSASQPAVLVLVGDPNLTKQEAEEAIQMLQTNEGADWENVWHVHTTSKQLSGDIVLVKGANAKPFDLPFGISHGDRGMRHDQHDAIGIELHFHSLSTPRSGASQPAASACGRAPQSAFSRDRSRSGGGRAKDVATMSQQKMSKQEGSEDVAPSTWRQIWAAKIAQLATKMQRRRRCSDEDAATKRRRCGDEAPQPASSTSSVDPPPSELAADAGLQDAWMRSGGPSAEVAEIASQLIIDRRHRKAVAVQAPVRARGSVAPHVSGALQPASSTLAPAPQRPVPRDAAPVPGDTAQAHGAPQPAMEPGALINQMLLQPATEDPNSLGSSRVAETLNEDMRSFLWAHPEFPLAEAVKLRSVLFSKKQHPVPADLWITGGASGASQPGDHQYVTAGVSETYVLQQLHGVLELRNGWLRQQNLPLHFQMRDQIERPEFLAYARYQYEIQPHQQKRQSEDWQAGGNTKLRNGMRSRWAREQQRRCGSPALWGIVSFTGRFEANYLAKQ